MIFHYGLYAQAGIVESWQLSEKDLWAREGREFRKDFKQLQLDYWNLIKEFNPENYRQRNGQVYVKKQALSIVFLQRNITMGLICTILLKQNIRLAVNKARLKEIF